MTQARQACVLFLSFHISSLDRYQDIKCQANAGVVPIPGYLSRRNYQLPKGEQLCQVWLAERTRCRVSA